MQHNKKLINIISTITQLKKHILSQCALRNKEINKQELRTGPISRTRCPSYGGHQLNDVLLCLPAGVDGAMDCDAHAVQRRSMAQQRIAMRMTLLTDCNF